VTTEIISDWWSGAGVLTKGQRAIDGRELKKLVVTTWGPLRVRK